MMDWLHATAGPASAPTLNRGELEACKSIVRGARKAIKWQERWRHKRETIPALRTIEGDDKLSVNEETMLERWTWLYANSKGFREMLITKGTEAAVMRLTERGKIFASEARF